MHQPHHDLPAKQPGLQLLQHQFPAERNSKHLKSSLIDPEEDTRRGHDCMALRRCYYAQQFGAAAPWHYCTGCVEAS